MNQQEKSLLLLAMFSCSFLIPALIEKDIVFVLIFLMCFVFTGVLFILH